MARQFDGRDITKTILNVGIGGEIELADALPSLSVVSFRASGRVGAIKHIFKDDGSVKEQVILTIDAETFEILGITKAAEQITLPLATGSPTEAETDEVVRKMNLRGPDGAVVEAEFPLDILALLRSCEACGHDQAVHQDQTEACQASACECTGYVPFVAAPAEEEMEAPLGGEVGSAVETASVEEPAGMEPAEEPPQAAEPGAAPAGEPPSEEAPSNGGKKRGRKPAEAVKS